METLHSQIKKTLTQALTDWIQTNELKKVLLIDNNKDAALLDVFCKDGYDVIHCYSVREAWNFVYPHPPHLIVIHLNDLNRAGLADLHECRALARGVPIILATSARVTPAVTKALENRTAGILSLPSAMKTKRNGLNSPRIVGMRR